MHWTILALALILAIQVALTVLAIYTARKARWAAIGALSSTNSVRTTQQIEHLAFLYRRLDLEFGALPPTRGWAASPDFLNILLDIAEERRHQTIVECGSGVSTLVLARLCRNRGFGRVVSFDHDEAFAGATRRHLERLGLADHATVVHAPLVRQTIGERSCLWYRIDPDAIPDRIDLLVIDGPPQPVCGELARLPALDLLGPRLGAGASVVFDDADRKDERDIVKLLSTRHPDWSMEYRNTEKGTVAFHLGGRD